jgi:hypothetical protein
MTETIFLSYAREDRGLVGAVRRALRKHGIVTGNDVVIMDPHEKLKGGLNARKLIKDQMSLASKVVIIGSENSANSVWVNYEAGMAAALGKPIVVFGKGTGKTASMLKSLGNVQFVKMEGKGAGMLKDTSTTNP